MELTNKPTKGLRRKKWISKKKSVIRFNQKKLIKTFAMYGKKSSLSPKNSTHEFEYFTAVSKSLDWKKKTQEEIEKMKKEVQWKAFEGIENLCFLDKPEMKKLFWKTKKLDNESFNCDEMWTFSSKNCSRLPVLKSNKGHNDVLDQHRIFWKTSKVSLPLSGNQTRDNKYQNQNMLWRSLKHVQRLYEEDYMDVRHLSEIFNAEFQKITENNSVDIVSDCLVRQKQPVIRKARLSRWTFLRHSNNSRKVTSGSVKSKTNQYSRFFVRKKNYSKNEGYRFSGKNKSSLFDDSECWKDMESDSMSDTCDSCNCSCCSCDKCADDPNAHSCTDTTKQLSDEEMAPNSEEDPQIAFQNKRTWGMEFADKEPLRPPVYNPEDYALSLKKWGRKANAGMQLPLYLSQSTGSIERISSDLAIQNKRQSSPSTKSSFSIKSGDEKMSKKEKELTLKMEKKDLKNKENINRGLKNELHKEFRNPILTLSTQEGEMSLRQFSSVTELLGKLKVDLKLSFPSFVQEFVGDPVDGVTLLLELLRALQLSQASQQQRCPPQVLRRALLDEHSCLLCLKHCLRCSDATRRLASSPAGLFTLAVCIMSSVTQSRIIALELLTKACEPPANGHKAVSEALSTLRLRFGEPVRFRFLVGMLNSAGAVELLATAMKFVNAFVETAPNVQQRIYIQAELEQAGFESKTLRRTLPCNSESVKIELNKWEKNYLDIEALQSKAVEVNSLQEKIQILEKRIQILQEEKGILQSLEQCLKERCSELEEEVSIKTSTTTKSSPTKPFRNYGMQQNKRNTEKGESTPAEDEGISSSEQELSQDEDYSKRAIPYSNANDFETVTNSKESRKTSNTVSESSRPLKGSSERNMMNSCNLKNLKNMKCIKMKETNVDDGNEIIQTDAGSNNEEEETTIDEVIEELENIVNDAETEAYASEEKLKSGDGKLQMSNFKKAAEVSLEEKCRTFTKSTVEKENFEETEIIPAILHPQPPRKAKSLVHIYFPSRDFDSPDHMKSEFFDEDTDSESSDSLLTREKKSLRKSRHGSLEISDSFNSFSSINTRTLFIKQEEEYEDSELNIKLGYEERNIDEEEIKRKHLKNCMQYKTEKSTPESFPPQIGYKDGNMVDEVKKGVRKSSADNRVMSESTEILNKRNFESPYEKTTSFQGIKSCIGDKIVNESPFTRRTQKFFPTPVKRSQTFHITTTEGDNHYRRSEMKPKPKMGVSGLDFQRSTEQKVKSEQGKYQSTEYKKNSDRKLDNKDRYSKRISKDGQKNQDRDSVPLLRRGSFDGLFTTVEGNHFEAVNRESKSENRFYGKGSDGLDKPKIKSKSLEKMDEGLDSLVDIVIASDETTKVPKPRNDWNVEVGKNIGPRTRRSLAESSLFNPQFAKSLNKPEESPLPPKPAQRTSLARNSSSSTPLHLPVEIKLAHVQPKQQITYNFGLKPAKSEDSLLAASSAKRYPPDGSSSPMDFKGGNYENQKISEDKTVIYSTPMKQSKLQKFFGNPKFENSTGSDTGLNQKYFETNYACTVVGSEKSISPMPRNIQNPANSSNQKVKNPSTQQKMAPPTQSKPNFLLGTYQSQYTKNNCPKPPGNSLVLNSINALNNSFLMQKAANGSNVFSGTRKNNSGYKNPSPSERIPETINNRQLNGCNSALASEKVTDSPSGLY